MPVDLPRNVIRSTGEGSTGLGETRDRVELPLELLTPPPARGLLRTHRRVLADRSCRRLAEPAVTLRIGLDDGRRGIGPFGAQLCPERSGECDLPEVEHVSAPKLRMSP